MSKYTDSFNKVEPSEEKKHELLYKTLQRKKELQTSALEKTESKPKKRFNWNLRRSVIAVSAAVVLIFCAIFIPIMANGPTTPAIIPDASKIIILDASASMMAMQDNGKTRFENSIEKARTLGAETIADKGEVTVILADKEAKTIVSTKSLSELNDTLNNLECTYGLADIDGAMFLAGRIRSKNKKAKTTLYTAKQYKANGIDVIDVFENEWNAAILSVDNPVYEDEQIPDLNYYKFQVTVASYNKETKLTVYFEAKGVNDELKTVTAQKTVFCKSNVPVVFDFAGLKIYEYDSVRIYINVKDSFDSDNEICLYDGRKETIKILYASSDPNMFLQGYLRSMQYTFKDQWKVELSEDFRGEIELKGYDFYIIEHQMPQKLPTDGLVWLINPDIASEGSGFVLEETVTIPDPGVAALSKGQSNPIINYIKPERIEVSRYKKITSYDGYEVLMYCGSDPAFMVKNTSGAKLAVLSFSLTDSNLPLRIDFPILMNNLFEGMFDYFLPPTITEYVFEVDDSVSVNARGTVLNISNENNFNQTYNSFPNITIPPVPGTYTLKQTLMSEKIATNKFFVKISSLQSDFSRMVVI